MQSRIFARAENVGGNVRVRGIKTVRAGIMASTVPSIRTCLKEVATLWACTHNFRRGVELNRRTQKTRV